MLPIPVGSGGGDGGRGYMFFYLYNASSQLAYSYMKCPSLIYPQKTVLEAIKHSCDFLQNIYLLMLENFSGSEELYICNMFSSDAGRIQENLFYGIFTNATVHYVFFPFSSTMEFIRLYDREVISAIILRV